MRFRSVILGLLVFAGLLIGPLVLSFGSRPTASLPNRPDRAVRNRSSGGIRPIAHESVKLAAANRSRATSPPATLHSGRSAEDSSTGSIHTFAEAVSLANLPDGQGLPSLITMAQSSAPGSPGQVFATEMLAQMSNQNAQALDVLVQMAQQNQIPASVWPKIASVLAGEPYQVGGDAIPNLAGMVPEPGGLEGSANDPRNNPQTINERIALLDTVLGFVAPDSSAAEALQRQLTVLTGKMAQAN